MERVPIPHYMDTDIPDTMLNYAQLLKMRNATSKALYDIKHAASTAQRTADINNPFATIEADAPKSTSQQALELRLLSIDDELSKIEDAVKQEGKARWQELIASMREYAELEKKLPEHQVPLSTLVDGLDKLDATIKKLYNSNEHTGTLYNKVQELLSTGTLNTSTDHDILALKQLFSQRDALNEKVESMKRTQREKEALKSASGFATSIIAEAQRKEQTDTREKMQKLRESNYDLEVALRIRDLRHTARDLHNGRIPYLPSVKKRADEIVLYAQEIHKPVLLMGDTGTGKTSLLLQVAYDYLSEPAEMRFRESTTLDPHSEQYQRELNKARTPYMISGHRHLELNEITGAMTLKTETDENGKPITKTKFDFGPLYRAMEEGKPLIIDEINTIPHGILSRLNDALTLKPGDVRRVQGDASRTVTVKEGFVILASGNYGAKFADLREESDVAMMDRFQKMDHDYLPQFVPRDKDTFALKDHASADNELFYTFVALHINDGRTFNDVYDATSQEYVLLNTLWNTAMAMKDLQNRMLADDKAIQAPSLRRPGDIFTLFREGEQETRDIKLRFEKAVYQAYISQLPTAPEQVMAFEIFGRYDLFKNWKLKDKKGNNATIESSSLIVTPPPDTGEHDAGRIMVVPEAVLAFAVGGPLPQYSAHTERDNTEQLLAEDIAVAKKNYDSITEAISDIEQVLQSNDITDEQKTTFEQNLKDLREAQSLLRDTLPALGGAI